MKQGKSARLPFRYGREHEKPKGNCKAVATIKKNYKEKCKPKNRCKIIREMQCSPKKITNKGELKEQKESKRRKNKIIGDIIYKVIAEESLNAKETAYDVIRRLIENNKDRICCLNTDGGQKIC